MWNFAYHLARARGAAARRFYRALLPQLAPRPIANDRHLDLNVFAYSGEASLPEQVASLRSFLLNAGRPACITVVSDGTHQPSSIALLRKIDPCVRIASAHDFFPSNVSSTLREYLGNHPTGKQLALIMSLPTDRPALYIDSDVLFFPGALALADVLQSRNAPAFYLPDCRFSGDERLLRDAAEYTDPANTGVLLIFNRLDWALSIERFTYLNGTPNFFTNQTMTHLALHANGARPLDPAKFVLQLDDQFVYRDRYASPEIVLRHYVNPVRHKFWAAL